MIAKLHYISQEIGGQSHQQNCLDALQAGAEWVQIRIKDAKDYKVVSEGKKIAELCKSFSATCILNDRPDLAIEIGAHGVHLGKSDMPISEARAMLGPKAIIGATANSMADILAMPLENVNYIGLGPLRFTNTKEKLSPTLGLAGYKSIIQELKKQQIDKPIIAIGAVAVKDVQALLKVGVHGVAVASLINCASNKVELIEELYKELQNG